MEIKKPKIIVDLKRVEQNMNRMIDKFQQKSVQFRPHFKTHQSRFIAKMFRNRGIGKCTVSSLGMAQYFAEDGWNDITIAFPANVLEADEMNKLAEKIRLNILVDSVEKVKLLAKTISSKIELFIEVDTGYFRSGILFDARTDMEAIIQTIEFVPQFSFAGFLSHTGNTYGQSSPYEIIALFDESRKNLLELKHHFLPKYPHLILSMGDTPAASLAENFDGVDEIRPGNFVFYDVIQYLIGSCKLQDIAVAVYCPIVAIYPKRNQVVVYGGGVHLTKEKTSWQGKEIFGFVFIPDQHGFGEIIPETYVKSLSQEHGIISMSSYAIEQIKLGDVLAIYPVHSCMTVDLNKELISLDNKQISKYRTY